MDLCVKCASTLSRVLTASPEGREQALTEIRQLENDADEIKNAIRKQATRRLFMPVSKEHLLDLAQTQDKIANRARDVAMLFVNRFESVPEPVIAELHTMLESSLKLVAMARKAIQELDELVETGFRGAEADLVEKLIEELDRAETEGDEAHWAFFHRMKSLESSMDTIDAMFIYRVAHLISDLGDRADQTGRKLGQLLAR